MTSSKSVLGRVRNCVGERALRCEMVASSYVCQPSHNCADFMFRTEDCRLVEDSLQHRPVVTKEFCSRAD